MFFRHALEQTTRWTGGPDLREQRAKFAKRILSRCVANQLCIMKN